MVLSFIRKRVSEGSPKGFAFLPASFLVSLKKEYQQYCRVNDIAKFSFSRLFGSEGNAQFRWDSSVKVLYCPFQLDGQHWVGVVIDITKWSITVLDCNSVVVSNEKMESTLQPLVVLFPYLLPLYGLQPKMEAGVVPPLAVTRVDPPMLTERTGSIPYYTTLYIE